MSDTITWLHLSDAHLGHPRNTLDATEILEALRSDLREVHGQYGLRPDLIFFTGDAVWGHREDQPISAQFDQFRTFLDSIRACYDPPIPADHVFIVPGNHDVHRGRVDAGQTRWLDQPSDDHGRSPAETVDAMVEARGVQWSRYMERLVDYRTFLGLAGYDHLLEDSDRLMFCQQRKIAGARVAICGLNTAWSCGRDGEKGKLWLGRYQVDWLAAQARRAQLSILLGHHPPNWLTEYEDPLVGRMMEHRFGFFLHGHEHSEWVIQQPDHVRIAGSCCYDSEIKEPGYNLVRLDLGLGAGEVFLRRFDRLGHGWIPKVIANRTSIDGVVALPTLPMKERRPPTVPPGDVTTTSGTWDPARNGGQTFDFFDVFSPAREIYDPERFVGRESELERGLMALGSAGAAIAIFGEAGVGKTSLAIQLGKIAAGEQGELVEKSDLGHLVPRGGFSLPVVYHCCRARTDTDLARTLLSVLQDGTRPFPTSALIYSAPVQAELARRENTTLRRQLDELLMADRGQAEMGKVETLFRNLSAAIQRAFGGRPLLVILDEHDQVRDKGGFAIQLKELDSAKFVLVGTAHDVRMLIQDHGSVPRQLAEGQIRLRPMSDHEAGALLRNEEDRSAGAFRFGPGVRREIVRLSRGMPFFMHFFGRYSLNAAIKRTRGRRERPVVVEKVDVVAGMRDNIRNLENLEQQYLEAIQGKWERELVLKLMAYRKEDDIFKPNVVDAARQAGLERIDAPLKRFQRVGILSRTGDKHHRFDDTTFKIFARLRPVESDKARRCLEHFRNTRRAQEEGWITSYDLIVGEDTPSFDD